MKPSDAVSAADFWAWSLRFYARPGVAAACLDLQDRDGRDVNLVLLLCWLAGLGFRPLTAPEIAALDRAVAAHRTTAILPARRHRIALKAAGGDAYAAAKAAELEAERVAQGLLVAAVPDLAPDSADLGERAGASLGAYGIANPPLVLLDAISSVSSASAPG